METGTAGAATTRRRRRWRRFDGPITVALTLLIITAAFTIRPLGNAVVWPWSISLTGGKTLTGVWRGQISLAPDDVRAVSVEFTVNHQRRRRCGGGNCKTQFSGRAAICTPAGKEVTTKVAGAVRNWSGKRFWFDVSLGTPPPGSHLYLGRVEGTWDGADTLRLRASPRNLPVAKDGAVTWSSESEADEVGFELERVDAFRPQCGGS